MNSSKEKTILIVEDDTGLLEVLKDSLSEQGFRVLTAQDGEKGLKTALTEHPDLILLDVIMPNMDGMEFLKQLRLDADWGKAAQIILLTNVGSDEAVSSAIEYGVHDYLLKSDQDMDDIIKKVKQKLDI